MRFALETRLNDIRIFGLPVQFVAVVAFSLALTIYFGAWAADARLDARSGERAAAQNAQQFSFPAQPQSGGSLSSAGGSGAGIGSPAFPGGASPNLAEGAQQQGWERFFLAACPLH